MTACTSKAFHGAASRASRPMYISRTWGLHGVVGDSSETRDTANYFASYDIHEKGVDLLANVMRIFLITSTIHVMGEHQTAKVAVDQLDSQAGGGGADFLHSSPPTTSRLQPLSINPEPSTSSVQVQDHIKKRQDGWW